MNQQTMPSPFFRKFMIVLASIICVFYLAYRAIFTFNLSTNYAVFASVFLYVGEFFGIINLLLYFLQVWEVNEPPVEPVLEGRTVDVLVPTYNEDPQLLRATLEACIRMDYPHKTYVLDDGRRAEVQVLAQELGVIYLSRPDNRHAKAGNLNNALEQTTGEFVVVLDADHVPEPHFITRLIGYFRDEKLAYVQTPHAFYNFDSFQARLDHKNRRYWEEGDLFYRVIQPGRNKWNAPIFAGSAAMFRRNALKEIGYIATETITEDMHTGLRLHGRGWKSLAISDRLVAGQAPPDITSFHSQRLRWGEGNLSIMAYDNPLFMAGLTGPQRFCYFGSMIHWASGFFKLAIYLTPILMLFTGVPPVREFSWNLIVVTVTYLFFSLYAMKVVSNGFGSIVNSELFSMVNFWTQTKATFRAMFRRRRQTFVVTSKRGPQARSVWPFVRPQTYLMLLSVLAIVWGWLRLSLDLNPFRAVVRLMQRLNFTETKAFADFVTRQIEGTLLNHPLIVGFGISDDYLKPVVPTIWCLLFFWLAYKVTQRAFWPANRRFSTRHQVHLPVEYENSTTAGISTQFGVTVDLNDTGMAFVAYQELPINSVLRFTVRGSGETVKLRGEIRSVAKVTRGATTEGYRYGVQFKDVTTPQVDAINRICYHYATPRMFDEYDKGKQNTFWNRLKLWQSRGMAQRRNAFRNPFHLPLVINTGTTEETMMHSATEDISRVAAAAMFENEMPTGSQVGYLLPTPLGEVRGTATVVRSVPTVVAGRTFYRSVLEFKDFEGQGRTTLQSLVNPNENSPLTPVLNPDKKNFLPNMRVPIIVGLLIAIPLILAQMGIIFPFYYKDDQFLKAMIDSEKSPSDEEVKRYKQILASTLKDSHPPTDRLVLLMTLGNKLNEKSDLEQVTQSLAVRDRRNLSLSKALVIAYDKTQKYAEAETEYKRLKELADQGRMSDADKKDLERAGARVAVHAEQYDSAIKRFEELHKQDPNDVQIRNEFAGVCNTAGKYDKTIEILTASGPPIDAEGRKYLIAAYFKKGRLGDADREVNLLLEQTHNSVEALQMQAELRSVQKLYPEQQDILERIKKQQPNPEPDILVKLARSYTTIGNYDKAIDELGILFDRQNYPVDALNSFVYAASLVGGIEKDQPEFDQARHDKVLRFANQLYDPALTVNSNDQDHALYLTRLGWVFQRLGENDKSSKLVTRALTIMPANDEVKLQLAYILLQSERPADAARVLGNTNILAARKLRAGIELKQKEFDKALVTARSIYEDERNWENEKFIADILSWKGEAGFPEAIKIYEKHLQQFPGDDPSLARVAEITLWAKQYNEAVAKFQALLEPDSAFKKNEKKYGDGFINAAASAKELTPAQVAIAQKLADQKLQLVTVDPLIASRLAWVMLKARNRERAEALMQKIVVSKDLKPDVKKEIAGVLAESGQFKKAIELLDAPQTDAERLALARLYAGAKEWKPALLQVEQVIAHKPAEPMMEEALILQADVTSYMSDYQKAIDMFTQLQVIYPGNKDLPIREAEVTLWAKQYDKALKMFQVQYDKYPTEPKVWLGFASAAAAIGQNNSLANVKPLIPVAYATTVQRIYERVIREPNVNDSLLLGRLAVAMYYSNEAQKAELLMNRALEMKSRDPLIRRELANSLTLMKRYKDAVEQYQGVDMTRTDRLRLVDIATSGEDLDLAVRQARFLVNQDPLNRADRKLLADVLSWRGDFSESLSIYEQLIREQPKNSDLPIQLADVTLWWRHYPEALLRYSELLNIKGDESRVYLGFIDAASSSPSLTPGQKKQALQVFEQYKDKIQDPARLARLAFVMIQSDRPTEADEALNLALAKKSMDPEVRKELAGSLARRERIDDAIAQFAPIEKDLSFADRITYAILLTSKGTKESLAAAEQQFLKLLAEPTKPKDSELRVRYAEMILWSGKYDKKRYAEAQREFEALAKDSPKNQLYPIRVAQSILWGGNYQAAMAKFQPLMDVAYSDQKLERDVWMGYVDSVAGSIGEVLRKSGIENEQPEKMVAAFFTDTVKQTLNKAFQRAPKVEPKPIDDKRSDKYLAELGYYTESLGRLGFSLGLMGEGDRGREMFERAISQNRTNKEIWQQYAKALTLMKEYAKAKIIYDALLKDELPEQLPR